MVPIHSSPVQAAFAVALELVRHFLVPCGVYRVMAIAIFTCIAAETMVPRSTAESHVLAAFAAALELRLELVPNLVAKFSRRVSARSGRRRWLAEAEG